MRKYTLTNDDYYNAEIAIYNDLPSTILYRVPESTIKKPSLSFTKHLLEGEDYKHVTHIEGAEELVVTTLGRYFNTLTGKQLRVLFNQSGFSVQFRHINVTSIPLYKELGWRHDVREIWDRYVENEWKVSRTRGSRQQGFI